MKIYFDCEFMESGADCTLYPLSLAFVASNDNALYVVISDADRSFANEFVVESVLPFLDLPPTADFTMALDNLGPVGEVHGNITYVRAPRLAAGALIADWVAQQTPTPEFWAWYAAYDWVVLCQLHGSMVNLPDNWPRFVRDLRQLTGGINWPPIADVDAPEGLPEHHALADAYDLRARDRWYLKEGQYL